jgi:hypothetical protein
MSARQLNLFATRSPLFGLHVKVQTAKHCCYDIAVVWDGSGPHYGELRCRDCDAHRGWLSRSTATWLESIINKFGAPGEPIVIRRLPQ